MAFGFSRYDLTQITRRIELPEISDPQHPLTLIVRYAGPGNRDWSNAAFLLTARREKPPDVPAGAQPPQASPEEQLNAVLANAEKSNAEAAQFYAETVLVGWENALDDGVPAEFTTDNARRLLEEMMRHVPQIWRTRIRDYVENEANFRSVPTTDPADLGKG